VVVSTVEGMLCMVATYPDAIAAEEQGEGGGRQSTRVHRSSSDSEVCFAAGWMRVELGCRRYGRVD